jgi:hypothetical protein
MALGANSYGDVSEIAALIPRYANEVVLFDASTTPALSQVESLTDQVSGIVNGLLNQYGFSTPVTQADAKLALDLFVNEQVAVLVEATNVRGRYGPGNDQPYEGASLVTILRDAQEFIEGNAVGFERLGATRSSDPLSGISYRDTDEGGDDTAPIFQRDAFGIGFKDWDT